MQLSEIIHLKPSLNLDQRSNRWRIDASICRRLGSERNQELKNTADVSLDWTDAITSYVLCINSLCTSKSELKVNREIQLRLRSCQKLEKRLPKSHALCYWTKEPRIGPFFDIEQKPKKRSRPMLALILKTEFSR
jgi:hypothetical protein